MKKLIEVSVDDQMKLYIEADEQQLLDDADPLLMPSASEGKIIKKTQSFLEQSVTQIKSFSSNIAKSIKSSDTCPDEFELEFAVKFAADAGIVISSINTEANIIVKMKWNNNKEK